MQQWTIPFVGDMLTQDPLLVDRTLEGGSGFVISDGNLDVQLSIQRSDEVGVLATAFNRMAVQLRHMVKSLRQEIISSWLK